MARSTGVAGALLPLLAVVLAGCAAQPPALPMPQPALPVLAFGSAGAQTPEVAIERWWLLFDDPHLHRRIADALARNADLAIAATRLRAARAQLDQANAAALPALDLSASSERSRRSAASMGAGPLTAGSHRLALTAEHELDLWGRLGAGTDAARARLATQDWARLTIEWSLSAQVAEAHFGERALQRKREILDAVRAARQHEVTLFRRAAAAGAASELELQRAQAELSAAESAQAGLARQALALQNGLAILTGVPLADLGALGQDSTLPLDPARDLGAPLPRGELGTLLARRPDLRRAEASLAAAQADLAQARASTLPVVRLSGQVGSDVRELSGLLHGPGFAWSLAASLLQPVFDGGRARARVEAQAAHADEASLQYRQAVATAVLDVREAYLSLQHADDALAAERQRVASLAVAERLARSGLRAGVLAQIDTLDAERQHLQAQLAEVEACRDRLLVQVQAFKALGGGHGAPALASATH